MFFFYLGIMVGGLASERENFFQQFSTDILIAS